MHTDHLRSPHHICRLFDALVLPALSYGCEAWVWEPRISIRATMQAESLHAQFLHKLLGVHQHKHTLMTLAEFCRSTLCQCCGNGRWLGSGRHL